MDEVPLTDLQAQRRQLGPRIDAAIAAVLDHGRFILGPEVGRLEVALAEFCGVEHAVACSSGTDALLLALLALGTQPGDAVVVPAFTFAATAEVVALIGATPVFADVDGATFNLDVRSVAEAVDAARAAGVRPVGVIAVDLFGQPADYGGLHEVAAEHGLWVLADAAQSLGAGQGGRSVGSLAAVTATSFFPAKPLGCYGDGGALFTDDGDLAARLRSLRVHGQGDGKYDTVRVGINGRLDTLQAAVLLVKLAAFPDELGRRAEVAERYGAALADVVGVPEVAPGNTPSWACYTVRDADRDGLAASLRKAGIASAVYYPKPLHKQVAYRGCPVAAGGLPVSERLAGEVLSLPIHAYLDEPAQDRVVQAVRDARAG